LLERKVEDLLARKSVVGLTLVDSNGGRSVEALLDELAAKRPVPVLPVWHERSSMPEKKRRRRVYIVGGRLLPGGSAMADVQRELERIAGEFQEQMTRGAPISHLDLVGN
jgi:hypothetical protein